MKTINKYLFVLAAAVFTFTACEKQTEREPSPAGNPNAISFEAGNIFKEINPAKAALEYEIKVARTSSEAEMTANIKVEGDKDIINVPTSVKFAAGSNETVIKLTFPNAQVDSTYSVVLSVDSVNKSPYIEGNTSCKFTVTIAAWEPAKTKAIVFDGLVISFFGVDKVGWYVDYLRKDNPDGSFDIRLLNPYSTIATFTDQFDLSDAYPYNEAGDVIEGTFNWDVHVAADGTASFDEFEMGMDYGYGMFSARFYDPSVPGSVYDATTNTITFPAKSSAVFMADHGGSLTSESIIIYLDATAYQNDHLSIADYNDPSIEWEEQESAVNQFESTIFNFVNEEQKLYKAVDQYPGNPKSPFINLYCLKDVYAEGGNLAFYWDGEDGAITIPTPQDTKLSFMKQELLILESAGQVATTKVKGTDVKVFSFDLLIVSEMGNEIGEFIETFTMANDEIAFDKSDFVGNFTLNGISPFDGSAVAFPVEVKAEGEDLILLGVADADTIWASFDADTKAMFIAPQALSNTIAYKGTDYPATLFTMDASGNSSTDAAMKFIKKLNGNTVLAADAEAIGYLIRLGDLGWWDGLYDLSFTPAAAAPAPAKAPAANGLKQTIQKIEYTNAPSVNNLSFKGKYHRQRTMKSNIVRF